MSDARRSARDGAGEPGGARAAARARPRRRWRAELAAYPQGCLRADRHSAYAQAGLRAARALDFEFGSLSRVTAESLPGAQRFATGPGATAQLLEAWLTAVCSDELADG